MGSRVGCHVSAQLGHTADITGVICMGYPLVGGNKKVRDAVLLEQAQDNAPMLFVSGDRDKLCPIDRLRAVSKKMKVVSLLTARTCCPTVPSTALLSCAFCRQVKHEIMVIAGGDHSLVVRKKDPLPQDTVNRNILAKIRQFVETTVGR